MAARWLPVIMVSMACVACGGGWKQEVAAARQTGNSLAAERAMVLAEHRRLRRGLAVPTLEGSSELDAIAQATAAAVAREPTLKHQVGGGLRRRTVGIGYPQPVAENLAIGHPSPQAACEAWARSPGHRANALNGRFSKLGFGSVRDPAGRRVYVAIYGTR